MSRKISETDYLARRPKRNQEWEKTDDNNIVLLVPKFGNHFLGKWIMSKLKRPHYRLKLDEIGSFIWERCDGSHNIKEIGDQLSAQFGEKIDPVHERLGLFFQSLNQTKSLTWMQPGE